MKTYLAWLGDTSVTFGQPNPVTGNYSKHGQLYAFRSIADRNKFLDTFDYSFNKYPFAVTKHDARSLDLGVPLNVWLDVEFKHGAAYDRANDFLRGLEQ